MSWGAVCLSAALLVTEVTIVSMTKLCGSGNMDNILFQFIYMFYFIF